MHVSPCSTSQSSLFPFRRPICVMLITQRLYVSVLDKSDVSPIYARRNLNGDQGSQSVAVSILGPFISFLCVRPIPSYFDILSVPITLRSNGSSWHHGSTRTRTSAKTTGKVPRPTAQQPRFPSRQVLRDIHSKALQTFPRSPLIHESI